jgi:hypothetical protein
MTLEYALSFYGIPSLLTEFVLFVLKKQKALRRAISFCRISAVSRRSFDFIENNYAG